MCIGSPACRGPQFVFCNMTWLLAGEATNSVWISDLSKRYFRFPTARCRDTNPPHLLFTWYRQLSAGPRRPLCEVNKLNYLLLTFRLSGVRHTLLHETSFLPAVILSATNHVCVLSEREWERKFMF